MGSTTAKALRYGPCVTRGSHSFTCHPHTNHTCLYSPAARRHRPLPGTHCAYPVKDGQAELTWWLVTYRDICPALNPDTVTHLSTNRRQTTLTTLRNVTCHERLRPLQCHRHHTRQLLYFMSNSTFILCCSLKYTIVIMHCNTDENTTCSYCY